MKYSFLQNGDTGLTVQFKNEISKEVNSNVASLSAIIKGKNVKGIVEIIPTFTSFTICYDPTIISSSKLKKLVNKYSKEISNKSNNKAVVYNIPVCYDDEFALDIDNVSHHTGLTKDEIISIHTSTNYLIYMLGFLPGFAYLGGMDSRLNTPRLDSPRTKIPQGAVGIGGEQTGIYPVDSPGGWQLIGLTPVKVYDKTKDKPILYSCGDYIRFVSIAKEEYYKIKSQVDNGTYVVKKQEVSL